jgi:hypothetical protein
MKSCHSLLRNSHGFSKCRLTTKDPDEVIIPSRNMGEHSKYGCKRCSRFVQLHQATLSPHPSERSESVSDIALMQHQE